MPRTGTETRVVVFAKAPEPGAVKTRLIPPLDAEGAAALHARLMERVMATACTAAVGTVVIACTPGTDHPFFRYCGARYGAALEPQGEGDLGARMLTVTRRALAASTAVILIGCDCPALTPEHLRAAARALRQGQDAVVAPAEDGGYVLIGLARTDGALFHDIPWGGAQVMADTRRRLDALGWRWSELDTLWDVDRPQDYERLVVSGMLDAHQATAEERLKKPNWPAE
ncbi:MAG: TIGR04282 family arsenosugar biosynthesis glycosyltransferase [Betaproteobacteria bacterium]|nr:TIGR04282 family arsenosugar biosynthesis glycosyltransferase [Betaproteobacteria bacterium]